MRYSPNAIHLPNQIIMQKIPRFFAIGFLLLTAFNLSFTLLSPLPQSASTQIGVVSADKMNILYLGVDNPVSVAIADVPIEETKVSISEGTLTETDRKGTFHVKVNRPGKATIRVEGVTNQGKTVSASMDFRVKRVADPEARLGGRSGGRIPIAKFKAQKGLTTEIPDFDYDFRYHIMSFEISTSKTGNDIASAINQGPIFTEQALRIVQQANIGDIIHFNTIRVRAPDGTTRKLPPLSFKLY